MSVDISQFQQVFFEEAEDNLATMEGLLVGMDIALPADDDLNAIFRAAHSIKGGAGMFGLADISGFTHVLETLLDRIRKHELTLGTAHVDAFLEAGDLIRAMIAGHRGETGADAVAVESCRARLAEMAAVAGGPAAVPPPVAAPAAAPQPATAEASATDVARPAGVVTGWMLELGPMPADLFERVRADLEVHGLVEVQSAPDKRVSSGTWTLELTGMASEDLLRGELEFVLPPEAIRLEPIRAVPSGAPLEPAPEGGASAASTADQGFGFFDDEGGSGETSAVQAAAPAADEGFGFFDDEPAAPSAATVSGAQALAATAAPVPTTVPATDEGFGFFDDEPPLAPPKSAAASPAPPPPPPSPPPPPAGPRPAAGGAAAAGAGGDNSSIRVSVGKVDQLINLVGELVINQAMLSETASKVDPVLYEQLTNGLAQLERNTRNLQESVMSMRMMPVSSVFSRFPRVVRDISQRLSKDIELRLVGEATEIDRGVIEKIADPLTHLVRNSLDHGIETPEVRTAAGKPARGTLTLRASHQGANIVIEVIDDGGGLRRDRILAKARERGFSVSEGMPDAEVWQLIFEPGFSTADQVTDVSGRGVGMDVVRRNIAELGGRIDIDSTAGQGTRITIRLPLTLAILDGLSVALGDETYIIPLAYIVESLQPQSADISTVGGQNHVVQVRQEYLPVLPLADVLGGQPRAGRYEEGIFVILESDATKIALFVDELVGENQVVIKSLESNYAKVVGISGATILGDGRVALILDVAALVRRCSHAQRSAA